MQQEKDELLRIIKYLQSEISHKQGELDISFKLMRKMNIKDTMLLCKKRVQIQVKCYHRRLHALGKTEHRSPS